ncbi:MULTISPECIES: hypothetical protein [Lactiplantibacillus]|nr:MULTISPECIES: hypothetical protein [Lactiplantibacillus]MDV0431376.1 hypothetical protein [Lactiplantibacillus sp. DA1]WDQ19911.1 hypothetical protein PTW40_09200 [Lactiplantibacillus plantarum]
MGAVTINAATILLFFITNFVAILNSWQYTVQEFYGSFSLIMYCTGIFMLALMGLEFLAIGFKKKRYSIAIIVFMIVNIIFVYSLVSTWKEYWIAFIFFVYSIFVGAFMWQMEKYLFGIAKKIWHKIPQFSDTAQVALMVGMITALVTVLSKILE